MRHTNIRTMNTKKLMNPPFEVRLANAITEMFPIYEKHINDIPFIGSAVSDSAYLSVEEIRDLCVWAEAIKDAFRDSCSTPASDRVNCDFCSFGFEEYRGPGTYHCKTCGKDREEA